MGVIDFGCYKCDPGWESTIEPGSHPRHCRKANASSKGQFGPSEFKGRLCQAGWFFDPIRGGECWDCDEGYERNGVHVEAHNACIRRSDHATRRAQVKGPAECQPGESKDAAIAGCWKCPEGWDCTVNPVTGNAACELAGGCDFKRGVKAGQMLCSAGQFYDIAPATREQLQEMAAAKRADPKPTSLSLRTAAAAGAARRAWSAPWGPTCGGHRLVLATS